MGDTPSGYPVMREPSVKTVIKDNGNRTAIEQWALLTFVPAMVLTALYFAVKSEMTHDTWYTLFTIAGLTGTIAAYVLLIRLKVVRWFNLPTEGSRNPDAALWAGNVIFNAWPLAVSIFYQAVIVPALAAGMDVHVTTVVLILFVACAIFSTLFFSRRMIKELLDPLYGNSIEIGVRERELRHDLKMAKLEAEKNRAKIEYAQELETKLVDTQNELAKAKRGSRIIYANHGSARGDGSYVIDDNELFNRFVYASFSGESRTRDEWSRWLIADPLHETVTQGRARYDAYRAVLNNAGLWNMKSGPVADLGAACAALRIPLPGQAAGGRAGVEPDSAEDLDENE